MLCEIFGKFKAISWCSVATLVKEKERKKRNKNIKSIENAKKKSLKWPEILKKKIIIIIIIIMLVIKITK